MSTRPNLVILRAGDKSIHSRWLNAPGQERTWDLIISYFGDDPEQFRPGDWLKISSKGPKMQALHDFIRSHEDLIREYDYVWLPEDDLDCKCETINRLFEICRNEKLALAQPSLTHDSYFSHAITLHNSCFRLRYTTFVEIMAPCFSSKALWRLLPTMNANITGWGLDSVWPILLAEDATAVAVLDEIQIVHTRPVGGGTLYNFLKPLGKTAWDEWEESLKKYSTARRRYWTRAAILHSGRLVSDGVWFLCLYGLGLLQTAPCLKIGWRAFPRFWLSAMYQQIKGRTI